MSRDGTSDWTPIETFRTAPDTYHSFRIAAYGDTRDAPSGHNAVIQTIIANEPDILLHTADLIGNGRCHCRWGPQFFTPAEDLMKNTTLFPCLGNHEYNYCPPPGCPVCTPNMWYYDFFSLPGNESWYAFTYGSVRIIALNTSVENDGNAAYTEFSAQHNWLKAELTSAEYNAATWKVVFFHHPPYSSCVPWYWDTNRPFQEDIRTYLVPLFEEHGVDIVLNGHVHNYERSHKNGVIYIVTGGGGAGLACDDYDPTLNPYSELFLMTKHHITMDIDPMCGIIYNAWDLGGNSFDNLYLTNKQWWRSVWSNGGSGLIDGWYTNPGDKYIAGNFIDGGFDELLAVTPNDWSKMLAYDGSSWQAPWGNQVNLGWIGGWNINPGDKYVAGDFIDGGADELLAVGDNDWSKMLAYDGTSWQAPWGNQSNLGSIGGWNINPGDMYIAGDFIDGGAHELLAVANDVWSKMLTYDGSSWQAPWGNGGDDLIDGWYINPGDKYIAGNFIAGGPDELLALANNGWSKMMFYNGSLWQTPWGNGGSGQIALWNMNSDDQHFAADVDCDGVDELVSISTTGWFHVSKYNENINDWEWLWGNCGWGIFAQWYQNNDDNYIVGNFGYGAQDEMVAIASNGWAKLLKTTSPCDGNYPPIIVGLDDMAVSMCGGFDFLVTAYDPDGTIPTLSTSTLPVNATFVDSGNGTGLFEWMPLTGDTGNSEITFYASDGEDVGSEQMIITVTDDGPVSGDVVISSDTIYAFQAHALDPMSATIYLGNIAIGHTAGDYDTSTFMINDTLTLESAILLDSVPGYVGQVWQLSISLSDFVHSYPPWWGTTQRQFTVIGSFHDGCSSLAEGEFTAIGHISGDLNADGMVHIADLIYLVDFLFCGGPEPVAPELSDLDGNCSTDISDLIYFVEYLFSGGAPLQPPCL